MALKLYADQGNPAALPALIAAKYNGVHIETPEFKVGVDDRAAEFLAKNPRGKLPMLETSAGAIFGTEAVSRYVARLNPSSTLLGGSPFEQALVDQWLETAFVDVVLPASCLVLPVLEKAPHNPEVAKKAMEDVRTFLGTLNKHLQTRTYLVGESVTLADLVVFAALVQPFGLVIPRGMRDAFVNVMRWFSTIAAQPNVRAVIPDVPLCETPVPVPKKEAGAAAAAPAKKADEPKPKATPAAKPAAAPAPAAAAPAAKPKPKESEGDEEGDEEEKPKSKNPLDLLPKSKLDLDWFKRLYSNTKDLKAGHPGFAEFWQNYDPEGYCLYFCEYKYPEECKVPFMVANQIRGFLQRLETLHKYAFGTMLILNESAPYRIVGCWLFRGTDVCPDLKNGDDYELYTWTRADHNDPATRTLIENYWTGVVPGAHVDDDWKVFK